MLQQLLRPSGSWVLTRTREEMVVLVCSLLLFTFNLHSKASQGVSMASTSSNGGLQVFEGYAWRYARIRSDEALNFYARASPVAGIPGQAYRLA
ncbi:hypothetical protein E3N88_15616 [Mikania micrantha]|uniref:Uncharacterized protein n=1 Tax=Mikania micrantha TaxID=192012 RepID=A0A5N6NYP0_9ASTR|nr:hypothetical protein E3N88_15616 [Mikania micrantha]